VAREKAVATALSHFIRAMMFRVFVGALLEGREGESQQGGKKRIENDLE
jgi:hypothetical protein